MFKATKKWMIYLKLSKWENYQLKKHSWLYAHKLFHKHKTQKTLE